MREGKTKTVRAGIRRAMRLRPFHADAMNDPLGPVRAGAKRAGREAAQLELQVGARVRELPRDRNRRVSTLRAQQHAVGEAPTLPICRNGAGMKLRECAKATASQTFWKMVGS